MNIVSLSHPHPLSCPAHLPDVEVEVLVLDPAVAALGQLALEAAVIRPELVCQVWRERGEEGGERREERGEGRTQVVGEDDRDAM